MRDHIIIWLFAAAAIYFGTSCEKNISLSLPSAPEMLVVEGRIETNRPPIIILTKNSSFYDTISQDALQEILVTNAQIKVFSETDTTFLTLYIPAFLPSGPMRTYIYEEILMISENDTNDNATEFLPFYSVPDFNSGGSSFRGEEGKTYWMEATTPDSFRISAKTVIPIRIPIVGLSISDHPDEDLRDSLVQVDVTFSVPDTFGNYVRYWNKRNEEPYYLPGGGTVFDDKLFVGTTVTLPLQRGARPDEDFNFETYGYFWKGDNVLLKWTNISRPVYTFYNSLENDNGDSPFSTPSIVQSNITDGLGVWAGYSVTWDSISIPF